MGKDPADLKYLADGKAVVNFSLACGWKSKDKEGCEWVNVVAFGKLAEIISQYCQKGQLIYVAGKMRTRKWQDKDGNDRYSTEIVADTMQLLGGRTDAAPSGDRAAQAKSRSESTGGGGYVEPPFDDSDIPFKCHPDFMR